MPPIRTLAVVAAVLLPCAGPAAAQSFLSSRAQPGDAAGAAAQPRGGNHWNALGGADEFRAGSRRYGTDVGRHHYSQTRSLGLGGGGGDEAPPRAGAPRDTPTGFGR
ncbi:hypothetical protein [Azospirillum sp. ST 5-10]|uniref:hypothetical protein n=1 Tax=unclassified Azospirillum TaxID=2630922 RepID=UPI003F4A0575